VQQMVQSTTQLGGAVCTDTVTHTTTHRVSSTGGRSAAAAAAAAVTESDEIDEHKYDSPQPAESDVNMQPATAAAQSRQQQLPPRHAGAGATSASFSLPPIGMMQLPTLAIGFRSSSPQSALSSGSARMSDVPSSSTALIPAG
jgi:hypothetical protein